MFEGECEYGYCEPLGAGCLGSETCHHEGHLFADASSCVIEPVVGFVPGDGELSSVLYLGGQTVAFDPGVECGDAGFIGQDPNGLGYERIQLCGTTCDAYMAGAQAVLVWYCTA